MGQDLASAWRTSLRNDAGAGHWGEYGDLYHGPRGAAEAIAVPGAGTTGADYRRGDGCAVLGDSRGEMVHGGGGFHRVWRQCVAGDAGGSRTAEGRAGVGKFSGSVGGGAGRRAQLSRERRTTGAQGGADQRRALPAALRGRRFCGCYRPRRQTPEMPAMFAVRGMEAVVETSEGQRGSILLCLELFAGAGWVREFTV